MSLRARLLAGVLVITAVGLLAAGGGTYLALRSFLLERVDQQLNAARASVGRGLRQSSTTTIINGYWEMLFLSQDGAALPQDVYNAN